MSCFDIVKVLHFRMKDDLIITSNFANQPRHAQQCKKKFE